MIKTNWAFKRKTGVRPPTRLYGKWEGVAGYQFIPIMDSQRIEKEEEEGEGEKEEEEEKSRLRKEERKKEEREMVGEMGVF